MINNELIEFMIKSYRKIYIIYYLYGVTIYGQKKCTNYSHKKKKLWIYSDLFFKNQTISLTDKITLLTWIDLMGYISSEGVRNWLLVTK